jgi:hypothetical protein
MITTFFHNLPMDDRHFFGYKQKILKKKKKPLIGSFMPANRKAQNKKPFYFWVERLHSFKCVILE